MGLRFRLLVHLVVVGLISVSCSSQLPSETPSQNAVASPQENQPNDEQNVPPAEGLKASGADDSQVPVEVMVESTGESRTGPQRDSGSALVPVGSVFDVQAGLSETVDLLFEVPEGVAPESLVVLVRATEDSEWQPVSSSITSQGQIEASIVGASFVSLGWFGELAADFGSWLVGRENLEAPSCEGSHAQLGLFLGTEIPTDTVVYCSGLNSEGEPLLRIGNNRTAYTSVEYPESWTLDRSGQTLRADGLERFLGSAVADLIESTEGVRIDIISGGDEIDLLIPSDLGGEATTDFAAYTWWVSGILYGLETLTGAGDIDLVNSEDAIRNALEECWMGLLNNSELLARDIDLQTIQSMVNFGLECAPEIIIAVHGGSAQISPLLRAILGAYRGVLLVRDVGRQIFDLIATLLGDSSIRASWLFTALDPDCLAQGPLRLGALQDVEQRLNVRESPSTSARVVETIELSDRSDALFLEGSVQFADDRDWILVVIDGGASCGWAASEFIEGTPRTGRTIATCEPGEYTHIAVYDQREVAVCDNAHGLSIEVLELFTGYRYDLVNPCSLDDRVWVGKGDLGGDGQFLSNHTITRETLRIETERGFLIADEFITHLYEESPGALGVPC